MSRSYASPWERIPVEPKRKEDTIPQEERRYAIYYTAPNRVRLECEGSTLELDIHSGTQTVVDIWITDPDTSRKKLYTIFTFSMPPSETDDVDPLPESTIPASTTQSQSPSQTDVPNGTESDDSLSEVPTILLRSRLRRAPLLGEDIESTGSASSYKTANSDYAASRADLDMDYTSSWLKEESVKSYDSSSSSGTVRASARNSKTRPELVSHPAGIVDLTNGLSLTKEQVERSK